MARIKYSALVENIRGSIAGTTFQNNKHGFTIKAKSNLVSSNTPSQQLRRSVLARASKAWSTLSNAQRIGWNTWASTYPQYTKHNPSSSLSGYECFLRTHFWVFLIKYPLITAPAYTSDSVDNLTIAFSIDSSALYLDISDSFHTGIYRACLFLSYSLRPTTIFLGSRLKYVCLFENADFHTNIDGAYLSQFGVRPAVGAILGGYYTMFNYQNGTVFAPVHFRVIVTAY